MVLSSFTVCVDSSSSRVSDQLMVFSAWLFTLVLLIYIKTSDTDLNLQFTFLNN